MWHAELFCQMLFPFSRLATSNSWTHFQQICYRFLESEHNNWYSSLFVWGLLMHLSLNTASRTCYQLSGQSCLVSWVICNIDAVTCPFFYVIREDHPAIWRGIKVRLSLLIINYLHRSSQGGKSVNETSCVHGRCNTFHNSGINTIHLLLLTQFSISWRLSQQP